MIQIVHTSTDKFLDEITTMDFKKTVGAMHKAPYLENYRRHLASLMGWLSTLQHGHDIVPDYVNKVKLPKKVWKTKTADEMLTKEDIFTAIETGINP